jgi:tRNA (cytidine/uridine-2'-O-)-methyltransferase
VVHLVLFEPEIAGNAGAVARTCLAVGARLHLIRPLGFRLSDEAIRRAGMDYWQQAEISVHAGFAEFHESFEESFRKERAFAFTTKSSRLYTEVRYEVGDVLLFGPESRGLPEEIRAISQPVRIPMRGEVRSLNLAVSAGIALYECWRQLGF